MVWDAGLDAQFVFCGPTLDVSQVLRETDYLLHPTPKEPFGVVLVEAMALGIPVLASNEGGPAEIVQQGENGLLFKPGDVSEIAETLFQVLHGRFSPRPPEWIRESVRRFSATEVARAYGLIYEDVLKGRVNALPRIPSQNK
jgi:glycosyltransferase involved in cell wall biosynthesis